MTRTLRGMAMLLALAVFAGTAGLYEAGAQVKKDTKAKDAKEQAKDKDKDKAKAPPAGGAATFEVYKDKSGEFRFRLRAADGDLLASSGKGYATKADVQKVIDEIKRDAPKAKVEDEAK